MHNMYRVCVYHNAQLQLGQTEKPWRNCSESIELFICCSGALLGHVLQRAKALYSLKTVERNGSRCCWIGLVVMTARCGGIQFWRATMRCTLCCCDRYGTRSIWLKTVVEWIWKSCRINNIFQSHFQCCHKIMTCHWSNAVIISVRVVHTSKSIWRSGERTMEKCHHEFITSRYLVEGNRIQLRRLLAQQKFYSESHRYVGRANAIWNKCVCISS